MDVFGSLLYGFSVALTPFNLGMALIGCFVGTIVGALPGLGPTNGVAILIPVAFALGLPPASALILLASLYYGTMSGGRISSILLNIPGDEPAVMTTLDGYPMAQKGQAATALALSAVASFVGATLATIGLTLFAPLLALGAMLRGSGIGFVAGVLPGAGASLGSFVAYTVERRISNRDDTFGKGDPRGVAAPEAGNNAAAAGALVPMLTLGVPGSGTTAVMLALLISLNITPGPLLFQQHPDVVWGLIAALYVSNLMLLVLNLPLVGIFARMLAVPAWILMPGVVMVAYVGIYSINHSIFDLLLITGFGLLGYVLRKLEIPLVPVVLGLLLGGIMETNLRRALSISNGDWSILVSSPLTWVLWALVAAMLGLSAFFEMRHARQQRDRARREQTAD